MMSTQDKIIYGMALVLMGASFLAWIVFQTPIFIADFVTVVGILIGYEAFNQMIGEWDI